MTITLKFKDVFCYRIEGDTLVVTHNDGKISKHPLADVSNLKRSADKHDREATIQ